ncbi:hypothetical protein ACQPZ2_30635 [Nocardia pseudovaccinii]|uniref:hypothetical protein n=1 Tax=Nocardia pseudovaccinii TaxID=189540 RepID=UPI003D92C043
MDPLRQELDRSPRALDEDAFFTEDRSTTTTARVAFQFDLDAKGTRGASRSVAFSGFLNKHNIFTMTRVNPLPHARRTDAGAIDKSIAKWQHEATYKCFLSKAARGINPNGPNQQALRIVVLFGVGSELFRHGICGAVEDSSRPTLLIDVRGIEPQHIIKFHNPDSPKDSKELAANNRWGVGITETSIQMIVASLYGRLIRYEISICAAFSTGYLGLQDSISKRLFPLDNLERVVLFDCLYGSLKGALERVQAIKGSAQIVAYIVTPGGNSFPKGEERFETLTLGKNPRWHYINLYIGTPMGIQYHAIASARLIAEAVSTSPPILDSLPADYLKAFADLSARLPARGQVVSSESIFLKVKGALPSSAQSLEKFSSVAGNKTATGNFYKQVSVTRKCITRAQLLGWNALPLGEEWHDMLLIEFAWEYLI